ncbi:Hypothetical_protein [Hexamita inflata]|uniref:Hypothetical_protein n=1 Tax=Hexamita inflata TaxID=28002 RepID=A0AA86TQC9_9EUKA|nr:Hypothetical protein HINF_LOCUS12060 [Hexamita inflata]
MRTYRPSNISEENKRLKQSLRNLKPTLTLDQPKKLPQQQFKVDFRDQQIAEDNLSLVMRVKHQYTRNNQFSSLDNTSTLNRNQTQRLVSEITKEKQIEKQNVEIVDRILGTKPEINFNKMDEKNRKIDDFRKNGRGKEINWARNITEVEKEQELKKAEKVVEDITLLQRQKLYFGKSQE